MSELFRTIHKIVGNCLQCGYPLYAGAALHECPRAKARATDPATSFEAARGVERSGKADAQREICLNAVKLRPGMTAGELAEYTGLDRVAAGRRLPELRQAGAIKNGPQRLCKIMGTRQMTWEPV